MSEKPISLIDDKKSSQVTYNTDQIMQNQEAQRAFFEHAENGNLFSPPPPEFEHFDLNEEAQVIDDAVLNANTVGTAQAPEYAQTPKSHEDKLKEIISKLSDEECLQVLTSTSRATILIGRGN